MKCPSCRFLCVLSILSAAAFSASCSNGQGAELPHLGEDTIRSAVEAKEEATLWTHEIEGGRLLKDISKADFATDAVSLSPQSAAAADTESPLVFPSLPGFGSMDTTLISTELAVFLNAFCAEAAKWQFSTERCEPEAIFSIILFRHDVQRLWQDAFGYPFPLEDQTPPKEDGGGKKTSITVFDSWIFGRPSVSGADFEIPVRFFCKAGYIDVSLFVAQNAEFYVNQIQIVQWGKKNGK